MDLRQNQLESASRAQSVLEAVGIQSVVIGGLAVAVWGEPRVTKDVDLRVSLQREQTEFLNEFDIAMVRNGQRIEPISGWPIIVCSADDLIVSKLITLRPRDEEDARLVIRRQRNKLDDSYVEKWLSVFEEALDDSTLVTHYQLLRNRYR
jgi:Nucleotidyltransferase of unknown function (DUF6036)